MTSSPAPDLDELERTVERGGPTDDVLVSAWRLRALLIEVRAARAAVAESGRLREALRAKVETLPRFRWRGPFGDLGTVVYFDAVLDLLATPPAPSDHGALDVERLAEAVFRWSEFDPGGPYADVKRRESRESAEILAGHYRAAATPPTEEAGL